MHTVDDPDEEPFRSGVASFDHLCRKALSCLELLGQDSGDTINDERFLDRLFRLQALLGRFFAREEEIIKLLGMPEAELSSHFREHDRLMEIFNDVCMDSMARRNLLAGEVYNLIRTELHGHLKGHDQLVRDWIAARNGLTEAELRQLGLH